MSGVNKNRERKHKFYKPRPSKSSQKNEENPLLHGLNETSNITNSSTKFVPYTILLPISTRAFGLTIDNIWKWTASQVKEPVRDQFPHSLYRISLMQLELKLQKAFEQRSFYYVPSEFENIIVDYEKKSICKQSHVYFKPIFDLITSVGAFNKNGVQYIPVAPKRKEGVAGLDPCLVNFSNLREYVQMLSDKNTPKDIRKHFFDYNPIPAAKWSSDDDPILMNAEDIMPRNYNKTNMLEDLEFLNSINSKDFKNYECKKINFKGEGKISQLLSCDVQTLKCDSDSKWLDCAWSPETVKKIIISSNNVTLFGETPRHEAVKDFSIYILRMRKLAKQCFPIKTIFHLKMDYNDSYPDCELGSNPGIIKVPISTRGFGFIVKILTRKVFNPETDKKKIESALYRLALKLFEKKKNGYPVFLVHYSIYYIPIPLSNMIALVPPEFSRNSYYQFTVPEPIKEGDFAYDPCLITISNLREYVEALSNPDTSPLCRKYFYDHNPIPGAVWNIDDIESPLLKNPDEIMPKEYSERDFLNDFEIMRNEIDKYTNFSYSDDDEENYLERREMRIKEIKYDKPYINKYIKGSENIFIPSCKMIHMNYDKCHVSGKVEWWSLEKPEQLESNLAEIYLFGEIPRSEAVEDFDLYSPRNEKCAKFKWDAYLSFY